MDFDIKKTIDSIMWGKSFVEIEDSQHCIKTFILRCLTIKEANFLQFIKTKEYDLCIKQGVLTNKELEEVYCEYGLWTEVEENRIQELKKQIPILQANIKNFEFFVNKKKAFKKELSKIEKEILELQNTKNSIYLYSAESRAEEIARRYNVMLSSEDIYENPIWKSIEEFEDENDEKLIYELALAYYKNNIFSVQDLRRVARHPEWRFRWNASKSGADLFGKPISQWSEMQNSIVYWSQYYDMVIESAERPSDFIIENDDACDSWINDQMKKYSSQSTGKNTNMFGTKKATMKKDHQEQFILVDPKDKDNIKKIQEMNPTITRQQLRKEQEQIKKEGKVSEWQLRKGQYVR